MTARTAPRLLAPLAALALLATACGGDDEGAVDEAGGPAASDTATPTQSEGSLASDFDFSEATFTVGSKEFTEQKILGEITAAALEAAGAEVDTEIGLQGSTIVREALTSGEIDMYWEYSGTGWSLYLGHDEPVDGAMEQFDMTAEQDLDENEIQWLGPAEFGNQYAIARRADASGPLGDVASMSDMAAFVEDNPDEATFCGAAEFFNRRFDAMQDAYDFSFPSDGVHQNDLSLDYVNVAKGDPCNFAEVFSTDARIVTRDLTVLDDDQGVFLTQLAALTARQETVDEYPDLADFAEELGSALTQDTVIELNKMVDEQGATPSDAAETFLEDNGFVQG